MINALIQNGDQTAVLKLPDDPFTLTKVLKTSGKANRCGYIVEKSETEI